MRVRLLLVVILVVSASPAAADWIVFLGGGIQEIKGPWELRGRQVLFHSPAGTLLSARADDVDLPTSAFLSWQVGERRHAPAATADRRSPSATGQPAVSPEAAACARARVTRVIGPETLELSVDGRAETVHLGCLDAPDTRHKFPQLSWYGNQTARAVEALVHADPAVCISEARPGVRDPQGHRTLFIELGDGRDLGAELVGRGLALAERSACRQSARYQELEDQARARERGHWGPSGNDVSVAIVAQSAAISGGPPLPRVRASLG